MALTDGKKADIAFKKAVGKTSISEAADASEELIGTFSPVVSNNVNSTPVPATKTDAVASGVGAELTLQLEEISGSSQKGWRKDGFSGFIDPGSTANPNTSGYAVEIFNDNGGSPGTSVPLTHSAGVFFDYQSGTVTLEDPSSVDPIAGALIFPLWIVVVKYVGRSLSTVPSNAPYEIERLSGKTVRDIDKISNPVLTNAWLAGAVICQGYVWYLNVGINAYGNDNSSLIGFDVVTKKQHPLSPLYLEIGGTPGKYSTRNLTTDGDNLWVVGNLNNTFGAKGYLWKVNAITGLQKFWDLSDDDENLYAKPYAVYSGHNETTDANGLTVDLTIWNPPPPWDDGLSTVYNYTLSGLPNPASLDDIAAWLNDPSNTGGANFYCRVARNPTSPGNHLLFIGRATQSVIEVNGTLSGYLPTYTKGPGLRGIDFDPINRNLIMEGANSITVSQGQKSCPFIWNIDTESAAALIDTMFFDVNSDFPGGTMIVCGRKLVHLVNRGAEFHVWDLDTFETNHFTFSGASFAVSSVLMATDGRYVFTSNGVKYEPATNSVSNVNSTLPATEGGISLAGDAVYLFSAQTQFGLDISIVRIFSKLDMKLIRDFKPVQDFQAFHVWPSSIYHKIPFDGTHFWPWKSPIVNSSLPDSRIYQIPADQGTAQERIRKALDRGIDAKVYETKQTVQSLKDANDFIGKGRYAFDEATGAYISALSSLVVSDYAYYTTYRNSAFPQGSLAYGGFAFKPIHMLDARSSVADVLAAGTGEDGNLQNDLISTGTRLPSIDIKGWSDGNQRNTVHTLRPTWDISGIVIAPNGHLWVTSDNYLGGETGNLHIIDPEKGLIFWQDAGGIYENLHGGKSPIVIDNIAQDYNQPPDLFGYILSPTAPAINVHRFNSVAFDIDVRGANSGLWARYAPNTPPISVDFSTTITGWGVSQGRTWIDVVDASGFVEDSWVQIAVGTDRQQSMFIRAVGGNTLSMEFLYDTSGLQIGDTAYGSERTMKITNLGHGGTTTPRMMDRLNEFLVIPDETSVHLIDVISMEDWKLPEHRSLEIPTTNAIFVHVSGHSIFVSKGTEIEHWKFDPNRIIADYDAVATPGTNQLQLSQPVSDSVKIGDLVYFKADTSSKSAFVEGKTASITGFVGPRTPKANLQLDNIPASGINLTRAEIYSFSKEIIADQFTNVQKIISHDGWLYTYDDGARPWDQTDMPRLNKINIETGLADEDWDGKLGFSWYTGWEDPTNNDSFIGSWIPGALASILVGSAAPIGTVFRVYGIDYATGLPAHEDLTVTVFNNYIDGSIRFSKLFGAKVYSTTGLLPFNGTANLITWDAYVTNAFYDIGYLGFNPSAGIGVFATGYYPRNKQETNEAFGTINIQTEAPSGGKVEDALASGIGIGTVSLPLTDSSRFAESGYPYPAFIGDVLTGIGEVVQVLNNNVGTNTLTIAAPGTASAWLVGDPVHAGDYFYVGGTDLSGSPQEELVSVFGGLQTEFQTIHQYKDIDVISTSNLFHARYPKFRFQRPARIIEMLVDGNHLVLHDVNNSQIIKKVL